MEGHDDLAGEDDPEEADDSKGEDDREQGVELGAFGDAVDEAVDYPTTSAALVEEYGGLEVGYADGAETVGELLGPLDEEYDSPEAVRQSVYNMVGEGAVGRERYTDRTAGEGDNRPPDEEEDVSF